MLSMKQGANDRQIFGIYRDAVTSFIVTFEQNKGFFAARIPYLYQQLSYLVRRCRQLRHDGHEVRGHAQLQEELFRLFGVRVPIPVDRQLSVLAGVIRHVLVTGIRMRRQPVVKGGVQLLVDEVRQQVCPEAAATNMDMLVLDGKFAELATCFPLGVCLLELRYFARLGLKDIAVELGVDTEAIQRDLRLAKAWLIASLGSGA